MFHKFVTLFRGRVYDKAEEIADKNALTILRQQLHEASAQIAQARKAVAVTIAQQKQEEERHSTLTAKCQDLETRILAALEQEKETLAHEGAQALAQLENEAAQSKQLLALFETEIANLKTILTQAEAHLRQLQHGQRMATACDTTSRLRNTMPALQTSPLGEAQETLDRLQSIQQEQKLASEALEVMSLHNSPISIAQKLAEQGCGDPTQSAANLVLDRLRKQK